MWGSPTAPTFTLWSRPPPPPPHTHLPTTLHTHTPLPSDHTHVSYLYSLITPASVTLTHWSPPTQTPTHTHTYPPPPPPQTHTHIFPSDHRPHPTWPVQHRPSTDYEQRLGCVNHRWTMSIICSFGSAGKVGQTVSTKRALDAKSYLDGVAGWDVVIGQRVGEAGWIKGKDLTPNAPPPRLHSRVPLSTVEVWHRKRKCAMLRSTSWH